MLTKPKRVVKLTIRKLRGTGSLRYGIYAKVEGKSKSQYIDRCESIKEAVCKAERLLRLLRQ